jgi:glutamine synthetase
MTRGLLTTDDLAGLVDTGKIDTVVVAFTDHYGRLHGKRFEGSYFLADIASAGTHGCDYLLTVDMEMEPVPGYKYANWELGYGDFHMVPDLGTLRVASWLDRSAIVLSDLHDPHHHELVSVAPRTILRRQLDQAEESGFTAQGASELEYFIYQDSYRDAAARRYQDLNPAGWYIEDYHLLQGAREEKYNGSVRRHLSASGIPVENSKGEWGRGQHEMNIRYANVLEMADRHSIMKLAMKEIAESLDMSVTFMAKPQMSEAGSSCHIHLSLWSGDDNAFPGEITEGPVEVSHRRIQGGRSRLRPADRVPHPGGGLQSLPRLRGHFGVGSRRDRQRDRAAFALFWRHLSGLRTSPSAAEPAGGDGQLCLLGVREVCLWRGCPGALRALLSSGARRL